MNKANTLEINLRHPPHLLAVLCMVAGLVGLLAGLRAHTAAMAVTGPTALAGGERAVLVALDHAIYRLDTTGEPVQRRDFDEAGIVGPVTGLALDGTAWLVADAGAGVVLRCDDTGCAPFLRNDAGRPAMLAGRTRVAGDADGWHVVDESLPCQVRHFSGQGVSSGSAPCDGARDVRVAGDQVLLAGRQGITRIDAAGGRVLLAQPSAGPRHESMAVAMTPGNGWVLVADSMQRDARLLRATIRERDGVDVWKDPVRIALPGENELADVLALGDAVLVSETNGIGLWRVDVAGNAEPWGSIGFRAVLDEVRAKEATLLRQYRMGVIVMITAFVAAILLLALDASRRPLRQPSIPGVQWLARERPEAVLVRAAAYWLPVAVLIVVAVLVPTFYVAVRLPELLNVLVMMQMPFIVALLAAAGVLWLTTDRRLRALPDIGRDADGWVVVRAGDVLERCPGQPARAGGELAVGRDWVPWQFQGELLFSDDALDALDDTRWRDERDRLLAVRNTQRRTLGLVLLAIAVAQVLVLALHGEPVARAILAG